MLHQLPEYIPILTFLFSIYFTKEIYAHYKYRKTKYLLWWTIGVVTFGLGTLTESINVIFGWSPANLKSWYIVGALLGGFPLAQGSVYLLMKKKFADTTAIILCTIIIIAAICVCMTPISLPENFDQKLTGKVFEWKWVRYFSPFVNLYAFVFLVGGAVYSAMRYAKMENMRIRYKGNIFIAIGALLPGIGGGFTRMGYVNMLFITELIGLLLIYYGYKIIKMDKKSISSSTL